MKSSVGVKVCAILVLIASAFWLVTAAGMAFMFAGPLSQQMFDPANLPPGADVRMMRTGGLIGSAMVGAFGALGIVTGIGMLRLWKWTRYSAIVMGVLVVVASILPGIAFLFMPLPPPPAGSASPVPGGFRFVLAGIYLVIAAAAGVFLYVMARKSTALQFNGGVVESGPRARPLSVSIIAWFMIVTAAVGLPMMAAAHLPAFVLGLLLTGGVAKAYYIVYFSLFALLGIGLLKRTSEALFPAIGLHAFALLNTLIMSVPSVWLRYQDAIRPVIGGSQAPPIPAWTRVYTVGSGVLVSGLIIFFLMRARRALRPAADQ
jgi:hypothetical protein